MNIITRNRNELTIMETLAANNGRMWRHELTEETGLPESTSYAALRGLRDKGLVDVAKDGVRRQYYLTTASKHNILVYNPAPTAPGNGVGTQWDNADREAMRVNRLLMRYMSGTLA